MAIVPDTKDWTWVLERPCPDCGFDASGVDPTSVAAAVRLDAREWAPLLAHPKVRVRPSADQWSALEYACHVRDVFRLFDVRLRVMLDEDDPRVPELGPGRDGDRRSLRRAGPGHGAPRAPGRGGGARVAARAVEGAQWQRTGTRSDGARSRSRASRAYLLHDPVHHVDDVEAGYAVLPASCASPRRVRSLCQTSRGG
jgi:hypothetical protein